MKEVFENGKIALIAKNFRVHLGHRHPPSLGALKNKKPVSHSRLKENSQLYVKL